VTQLNFVILVVGDLGQSGEISFKSMLSLNPKRICYLADQKGEFWLRNISKYYKTEKKILCSHQLNKTYYHQLKIDNNFKNRQFGQESFIRITPLKWLVISQVLTAHSNEKFVVFSDLDVIWFDSQKVKYKSKIQIQDDSWESSKNLHYCTGIMIWPNTNNSIKFTRQLYKFQKNQIQIGNLLPDEPAFNTFIHKNDMKDQVIPLRKNDFLIGHRAIELITREKNILRSAAAYHANYFIGDKQKTIVLKTILSRRSKKSYWIFGVIMIYLLKAKNKLLIELNKITSRSKGK
jgi:hypothetical protein